MGMDGLSMANTGALKESTSADFASKTEQARQADASNNPNQVQTLSTEQRVKEKEEEEQEHRKNQNSAKQQEEFEDGLVEENKEDAEEFDIEELDNPNKDFYVKLNAKDDVIELYDSATDRLIENISGNELQELVKRLNMASGIFVNKKV